MKGVIVVPGVPGVTPPPALPVNSCRITGGGSVFTTNGVRVTHGFQLRAPATELPQSLEVNWNVPGDSGSEMHFHLTDLTFATCVDNPNISPGPGNPGVTFDTFIATGVGDLNGVPGATIELIFTDAGEPGTSDTATMTIRDSNGTVVLDVSNVLTFGNQQMH